MAKNDFIKKLKLSMPDEMEYYVPLTNDKEKTKFISRVEKVVRSSMEYKDYIQFLKEHVGLDSCVFFQNVTNNKKGRISIEIHHEPFTLYDIVAVVLEKFIKEGRAINDLDIADEVMELHYANKVGLVPLSKTAHQVVHNSTKLFVPLNMVYGQYSQFLNEYDEYINEDSPLYEKLERKVQQTKDLTKESFDALTKEFTYLEVEGVETVEKVEVEQNNIA